MKKILALLISVLLFLLASCKKDRNNYDLDSSALPPNMSYFQLLKPNGQYLSLVEMDSLKLFYINEDGERQYQNPMEGLDHPQHLFKPSASNPNDIFLDNQGVVLALYVNGRGVVHNTWYFEQMDGRIDTLYVESEKVHSKEADNNSCGCVNPFTVVRLNGKDASIHPNLRSVLGKNIYVLKP